MRRLLMLVAASTLLAAPAQASQITGFGQVGSPNVFFATDNGDGTTSLDALAIVGITNILVGPTDPAAIFEFHADSIDAAQLIAGTIIEQSFQGTFSLHNAANTIDYLDGTFGAALMLGGNGGTGSLFTSNTAGLAPLTFTTDLPIVFTNPESFSLSLSNLQPVLGLDCAHVQCTIGSFNASFTGTADGAELQQTPVPEPASLVLLGSGLVGIATQLKRKMKKQCVT